MLISLCSVALAMGLIYHYLLKDHVVGQALVEQAVIGLAISLLLGLTICWLRTALDLVHTAQQQVLAHLDPADVVAYTIRLQVPEQILVWADWQLLFQVLRNLLSNVFKYVPRQTEIRIEATQAAPSSPVCLWVQDAGPGIPADELTLLFEKFVRLKRDVGGQRRGTGLGLYICKRFVEAMGGRIWVESSGRLGEGSRFCLTLPPVLPSAAGGKNVALPSSLQGVCWDEVGVIGCRTPETVFDT